MTDYETEMNAKYPGREAAKRIVRGCGYDKQTARESILYWVLDTDPERLDRMLDTIDVDKMKELDTPDIQKNSHSYRIENPDKRIEIMIRN